MTPSGFGFCIFLEVLCKVNLLRESGLRSEFIQESGLWSELILGSALRSEFIFGYGLGLNLFRGLIRGIHSFWGSALVYQDYFIFRVLRFHVPIQNVLLICLVAYAK